MDSPAFFADVLAIGAAHCIAVVEDHGGLLISLLITGLLGSATHCVGMCGPLVLAQTGAALEGVPATEMREWHRLKGGLLLPYHLGRATTYAALGALAAGLFGLMPDPRVAGIVGAALLVLAAIGFVGYALPRLGLRLPLAASPAWAGLVERVAKPLFARPVGARGYLLGVALGFIPCGLVYAALAAAASSGSALAGFAGMLGFALGTMPALIGVGIMGGWAAARFRSASGKILPLLYLANAAFLLFLAHGLAKPAFDAGVGGDFDLVGPDGRVVAEREFRGKALIVYFGYTFCPDICPTSLIQIADGIDLLPEAEREKVAAIFVSVDPERDTPETLATYTRHFHPQILGLSGSAEQIARAARAYHVFYKRVEGQGAAEYLMDHSTLIYLMGADGRLVRTFPHDVDSALLAEALARVTKDIP